MTRILLLLLSLIPAAAYGQAITNPAPVAGAGAYNTVLPTCTNGQFCFLQVDSSGRLLVYDPLPIPAGSNLIGVVGIDQTTPGTTNAVQQVDTKEVTGSATATGAFSNMPIDTKGYDTAIVYFSASGNAANRVQFESSGASAGTYTVNIAQRADLLPASATPGNAVVATTVGTQWVIPLTGRYLQLRSTVQSGGTDTAIVTLRRRGSTLGVVLQGPGALSSGQGAWTTVPVGLNSSSAGASTQATSTAYEASRVIKNAAGVLYSINVSTGGSAGFLMIYNATSAPGDGAGKQPLYCAHIAANSDHVRQWNIGLYFSTGISAVFSTGADCANQTASATAWFSAQAY